MENTNRTQLSQGSKANRLNNFLLEKGKEMNLWGSLIMVLGGGDWDAFWFQFRLSTGCHSLHFSR